MRLAICTTTWKRPELTKAVFDWWEMLEPPEGVEMFGVAVGDGDYSSDFWLHYPYENEPLGRKHNAMIQRAKMEWPDAVMVIGSDDIVQAELVSKSVEALRGGALWTQPSDLYFWHESGRVAKAASKCVTGAGRCYSAKLLDYLDWRLWPDEAEHKLDGHAERRIFQFARNSYRIWPMAATVDAAVLDIKTDVNLWPYEDAVAITNASEIGIQKTPKGFGQERFTYGAQEPAG